MVVQMMKLVRSVMDNEQVQMKSKNLHDVFLLFWFFFFFSCSLFISKFLEILKRRHSYRLADTADASAKLWSNRFREPP